MRYADSKPVPEAGRAARAETPSLLIATILREEGTTGVHTHVRQLRRYLAGRDIPCPVVTPFSRGVALAAPVFGVRMALDRFSGPASVMWYRHWHEVYLRSALRSRLASLGDCTIYAQGPLAARAALRARQGAHQRVVMAVHYNTSQANEWEHKKMIGRDGYVFRLIRQDEREVMARVDGITYGAAGIRDAVLSWLPEAAQAPSAIIGYFVASSPLRDMPELRGDLVTIGNLDFIKNHDYLLEVLAELRRTGRILTLDVFGEGRCRKDLMARTRSLGLEQQVRFMGFRADVRDLLPGYRVYVHSAKAEGAPLAIIEAMEAGLPVVTTKVGGIGELCDEGVEARFWPLDDAVKAATTLADLLDCETERARAAAAAARRFKRDFDANVVGPKLLSFLIGASSP